MPIKVYAGKRKSGAKREYHAPAQVYGPGETLFGENGKLRIVIVIQNLQKCLMLMVDHYMKREVV
jgi:hypothetical protein